MKVEGVTFNERLVRKMKKKEFVDMHKKVFFLDRTAEDRESLLSDIYDRICDATPRSRNVDSVL